MVEKIRVSAGSISALGLDSRTFSVLPSTCYLMTYYRGHCTANCAFCPQAREASSSADKLSRISWPEVPLNVILKKLRNIKSNTTIKRICIQTINYPGFLNDLYELIIKIKKKNNQIPLSTAITPISDEALIKLKNLGVERIAIALDCSTPDLFDKIKGKGVRGPYLWDKHFSGLKIALKTFPNHVSTHIIVGMGETEEKIIKLINHLNQMGILIALFAFMPIKGTKLENLNQPPLLTYRKIQLARDLLVNRDLTLDCFTFDQEGTLVDINISQEQLREIIYTGTAFLTTGCPGCNRPFYTSRPSGPIYNFPRKLNNSEKNEIYRNLIGFLKP